MKRPTYSAAALSLCALTATALTACEGGSSERPEPSQCSVELDNEGSEDILVIFKDGSISNDASIDYSAAIAERVLTDVSVDGPKVSIGTFGGTDAQITFSSCFNERHFRPDYNQPRRRAAEAPKVVAAALVDLAGLPSSWETTDPTSAFRAASEKLDTSAEVSRKLVLLTDGIPTAGCAQLPESTDPTDTQLIAALVDRCVAANAIPNLSGVDILIVGVGRTGTALTSESIAFLTSLNEALCAASGGNCTVAIDLPSDF